MLFFLIQSELNILKEEESILKVHGETFFKYGNIYVTDNESNGMMHLDQVPFLEAFSHDEYDSSTYHGSTSSPPRKPASKQNKSTPIDRAYAAYIDENYQPLPLFNSRNSPDDDRKSKKPVNKLIYHKDSDKSSSQSSYSLSNAWNNILSRINSSLYQTGTNRDRDERDRSGSFELEYVSYQR